MQAALAARPRARGAGELRTVLHGETKVSLSPFESRFTTLLRERHLDLPHLPRTETGV